MNPRWWRPASPEFKSISASDWPHTCARYENESDAEVRCLPLCSADQTVDGLLIPLFPPPDLRDHRVTQGQQLLKTGVTLCRHPDICSSVAYNNIPTQCRMERPKTPSSPLHIVPFGGMCRLSSSWTPLSKFSMRPSAHSAT